MLLVDSSVWVALLRRPAHLRMQDVGDFDEFAPCLPIVQEVLQGFRDEGDHREARDALRALPTLEAPMSREVFEEAAQLYRSGRRAGVTIRSSVDCLIAAVALRHGVTVVHVIRDYEALAWISELKQRGLRAV